MVLVIENIMQQFMPLDYGKVNFQLDAKATMNYVSMGIYVYNVGFCFRGEEGLGAWGGGKGQFPKVTNY